MKRTLLVGLFSLVAASAFAASSTNVTLTVNSGNATAVGCGGGVTGLGNVVLAPMAAGSLVCNITVTPTYWTGGNAGLSLTGANASSFVIGPASGSYVGQLLVGATPLAAGTYSVTINANP